MKRILLRARKGPFDIVTPEQTLKRNTIGNNSGNLVFSHAAHRLLLTRHTEVISNRFKADPRDAGRINDEFDVFVVPLANAFRPSFQAKLQELTRLIERLTIPVVILGVGAQGTLDYDSGKMGAIEPEVKRFVKAALDRGPTLGVRGEFTHDYLKGMGFNEVEVIGCPSMFLYGPDLRITKRAKHLTTNARVAINVSPYVKHMATVIGSHNQLYPNLRYIAQDIESLEMLLWGNHPAASGKSHGLPVRVSHPLYRENKIRFFVDPWPWIDYLNGFDFSFGTRIHGNIAALLAGVPAYVLAHDSRTLELARYFEIPHRKLTASSSEVDARSLYEHADYGPLLDGHVKRFNALTDFLEKHGLDHSYATGNDRGAAFDAALKEVTFPPGVEVLSAADQVTLVDRIARLRQDHVDLSRRVDELASRLEKRPGRRAPFQITSIGRMLRKLR